MSNLTIDLDVIRRCMLRNSTAELDMVVTANPVGRCMIIAKALHEASLSSSQMEAVMSESRIMDALKQEALQRQTGKSCQSPLTLSDQKSQFKERQSV